MNRLKRKISLGLFLLAYGFSVYWCFFRSAPIFRPRPVEITLAHWQIERGPPDGIEAAIRRYEELQPRVKVVQLLIPGGTIYPQWMRSTLAGDNGADIMEWINGIPLEGQRDVPARYFTPLTAALAKPNPYDRGTSQARLVWQDTFHDKLAGPRRDSPHPGDIYGVSISDLALRIFCNVALLREVTGSDAAPKTFNDLRKIFAQVRAYAGRTGRPVRGMAGSRDNGLWVSEAVMSAPLIKIYGEMDANGYLYIYNRWALAAYLEGRWSYSRPEMKAALRIAREVSEAMKPGFMQLRRDDAFLEFLRGEAVFIYSGSWDATSLSRLAPFKVVPMRVPPVTPDDPEAGRYVTEPGGEGHGETTFVMYINQQSRHKAEALDFLQFLTSVEGQQLFTDHSGWLPSVNGVKLPEAIKSFRDYVQGVVAGQSPLDAVGSEVNLVWMRNFDQLTGNQGSVDRFAQVMDREAPAAIRRDLENEKRNLLLPVKPQDAVIVATAELAPGSAHQHQLEESQTISEGLAFQVGLVLQATSEGRSPTAR